MLGIFGQIGTTLSATAQMLPLAWATTCSPLNATSTESLLPISDSVLDDEPSEKPFENLTTFLLFTTPPLASRRRPSAQIYLRFAQNSRTQNDRSDQIFYLYRASALFAANGDLEKAESWIREAYGVIRRHSPNDALLLPVLKTHKRLAEATGHYWSAANRSKKIAKLLKDTDPQQAKFYAEEALKLYDKVLRHRSAYARRAPWLDLDAEIERSKASVRKTLTEIGAGN